MNRDSAAFACLTTAILTAYLTIAALGMSRALDQYTTPAHAVAVLVGVLAGGVGVVCTCLFFKAFWITDVPVEPLSRSDWEER